MLRRRRALNTATATAALGGLAVGSLLLAPLATADAAVAHSAQQSAGAAAPPYGEIVVSDGAAIRIYAPGANGDVAPVRTISGSNTQLELTFGLALDPQGHIWVIDYGAGQIDEFAADAYGNV